METRSRSRRAAHSGFVLPCGRINGRQHRNYKSAGCCPGCYRKRLMNMKRKAIKEKVLGMNRGEVN